MSDDPNSLKGLRPKKLKTLRLLVESGEVLSSTLSLHVLYESLLGIVTRAMPCDGFIVSSFNSQTKEMTCEFASTGGNHLDVSGFPKIKLTESGGMQSQVIRTGESQIYRDVTKKIREPGGTYFEVTPEGTMTLTKGETSTSESVMVPIKLDGVVVGVLQVSCEDGKRSYEEEDLRLLEGLVHQLAIVAQNARLYERARNEVAERKRVEDGLRSAEGRLLQVLNAIPTIVWSVDRHGNLLGFNDRLTEYCGEQPANALAASGNWAALIHPEEFSSLSELHSASLQSASAIESENRLRRKDGAYRWHLLRMVPIFDGDEVERWLGTATDIHDLKDSSAALEAVLKNARDGIFRVDQELQWVFLNPAAEDLFGTPSIKIGSSVIGSQIPGKTAQLIVRACEELFSGEPETSFDFTTGLRHYTVLCVRETKRDSLQTSALFVCRDITASIEAKIALEHINEELERRVTVRTEELAKSIEEMEGFAYSISHDFRTPLRAISATSSILLEEFDGTLTPTARDLLERQAHAAAKLGHIVDELLQFSRYSRAELAISRIDLSALAESAANDFIICDPALASRIFVEPEMEGYGDANLLKLVFSNLIENAIKFSPEGGSVQVGSSPSGEIFVKDLGVGFDLKYAEKIWRPFERLVTEHEFPGTGIGLANVKKIIERHHGSIRVESAVGKGTTFFFQIPEPDLAS